MGTSHCHTGSRLRLQQVSPPAHLNIPSLHLLKAPEDSALPEPTLASDSEDHDGAGVAAADVNRDRFPAFNRRRFQVIEVISISLRSAPAQLNQHARHNGDSNVAQPLPAEFTIVPIIT